MDNKYLLEEYGPDFYKDIHFKIKKQKSKLLVAGLAILFFSGLAISSIIADGFTILNIINIILILVLIVMMRRSVKNLVLYRSNLVKEKVYQSEIIKDNPKNSYQRGLNVLLDVDMDVLKNVFGDVKRYNNKDLVAVHKEDYIYNVSSLRILKRNGSETKEVFVGDWIRFNDVFKGDNKNAIFYDDSFKFIKGDHYVNEDNEDMRKIYDFINDKLRRKSIVLENESNLHIFIENKDYLLSDDFEQQAKENVYNVRLKRDDFLVVSSFIEEEFLNHNE